MIHGLIDRGVSTEDNMEFCMPIIVREIEEVLHSMDVNKAPKLDGFSEYFYKYYSNIIKSDVVAAVQYFSP